MLSASAVIESRYTKIHDIVLMLCSVLPSMPLCSSEPEREITMKSIWSILVFCLSMSAFAQTVDRYERNRREDRCVHINFWVGLGAGVAFTTIGVALLAPQDDFNMIRTPESANSTKPTYRDHQAWSLGAGIPFVLAGVSSFAWMVGAVVTGCRLGTCAFV